MATVTKGRTFTSGETVTPTKLNEIVDNATVTNIVNADISSTAAIALSKLATGALPAAITVASANLVNGAVSNAKLRDSAALSVIGNSTNASADPADIAAGTDGHVLRRSGTAVGFGTVATAGIADAAIIPAKLSQPFTLATSQASTSGTSIDFTGIPSWVRRITVMLDGVSTNGSSNLLVQLGTSTGVETTNYRGTAFYPGGTYSLLTSGVILIQGGAAANIANGSLSFSFVSGNTWAGSGIISYSNAAAIGMVSFAKTLGGVLDRVRFTTVGGTNTFDAGTINISYEG